MRPDFGSTAVRAINKLFKQQKRQVPRLSQPFPTRGFTYSLVDFANTWHGWRQQVRHISAKHVQRNNRPVNY